MVYSAPIQSNQHLSIEDEQIVWFLSHLEHWGDTNRREFPWRETNTPYEILIAEVLLQQTDAKRVEPVYVAFLREFPNIQRLSDASYAQIESVLQPLGFHFRADRLHQLAKYICKNCSGNIPDNKADLEKLKGIGPYAANSICANAFGQDLAIVDTNVIRIYQRFYGIKSISKRPRRDKNFWDFSQRFIAKASSARLWNLTLLDFGALVCTHYRPKCNECDLNTKCFYYKANEREMNTHIDKKRVLPD